MSFKDILDRLAGTQVQQQPAPVSLYSPPTSGKKKRVNMQNPYNDGSIWGAPNEDYQMSGKSVQDPVTGKWNYTEYNRDDNNDQQLDYYTQEIADLGGDIPEPEVNNPYDRGAWGILDRLGTLGYGVKGGIAAGIKGENILEGAGKGMAGAWQDTKEGDENRIEGSELLELMGWKKDENTKLLDPSTWTPESVARGVAGLGVDIFTDPLSYITGGGGALKTLAKQGDNLKIAEKVGTLDDAVNKLAEPGLLKENPVEALEQARLLQKKAAKAAGLSPDFKGIRAEIPFTNKGVTLVGKDAIADLAGTKVGKVMGALSTPGVNIMDKMLQSETAAKLAGMDNYEMLQDARKDPSKAMNYVIQKDNIFKDMKSKLNSDNSSVAREAREKSDMLNDLPDNEKATLYNLMENPDGEIVKSTKYTVTQRVKNEEYFKQANDVIHNEKLDLENRSKELNDLIEKVKAEGKTSESSQDIVKAITHLIYNDKQLKNLDNMKGISTRSFEANLNETGLMDLIQTLGSKEMNMDYVVNPAIWARASEEEAEALARDVMGIPAQKAHSIAMQIKHTANGTVDRIVEEHPDFGKYFTGTKRVGEGSPFDVTSEETAWLENFRKDASNYVEVKGANGRVMRIPEEGDMTPKELEAYKKYQEQQKTTKAHEDARANTVSAQKNPVNEEAIKQAESMTPEEYLPPVEKSIDYSGVKSTPEQLKAAETVKANIIKKRDALGLETADNRFENLSLDDLQAELKHMEYKAKRRENMNATSQIMNGSKPININTELNKTLRTLNRDIKTTSNGVIVDGKEIPMDNGAKFVLHKALEGKADAINGKSKERFSKAQIDKEMLKYVKEYIEYKFKPKNSTPGEISKSKFNQDYTDAEVYMKEHYEELKPDVLNYLAKQDEKKLTKEQKYVLDKIEEHYSDNPLIAQLTHMDIVDAVRRMDVKDLISDKEVKTFNMMDFITNKNDRRMKGVAAYKQENPEGARLEQTTGEFVEDPNKVSSRTLQDKEYADIIDEEEFKYISDMFEKRKKATEEFAGNAEKRGISLEELGYNTDDLYSFMEDSIKTGDFQGIKDILGGESEDVLKEFIRREYGKFGADVSDEVIPKNHAELTKMAEDIIDAKQESFKAKPATAKTTEAINSVLGALYKNNPNAYRELSKEVANIKTRGDADELFKKMNEAFDNKEAYPDVLDENGKVIPVEKPKFKTNPKTLYKEASAGRIQSVKSRLNALQYKNKSAYITLKNEFESLGKVDKVKAVRGLESIGVDVKQLDKNLVGDSKKILNKHIDDMHAKLDAAFEGKKYEAPAKKETPITKVAEKPKTPVEKLVKEEPVKPVADAPAEPVQPVREAVPEESRQLLDEADSVAQRGDYSEIERMLNAVDSEIDKATPLDKIVRNNDSIVRQIVDAKPKEGIPAAKMGEEQTGRFNDAVDKYNAAEGKTSSTINQFTSPKSGDINIDANVDPANANKIVGAADEYGAGVNTNVTKNIAEANTKAGVFKDGEIGLGQVADPHVISHELAHIFTNIGSAFKSRQYKDALRGYMKELGNLTPEQKNELFDLYNKFGLKPTREAFDSGDVSGYVSAIKNGETSYKSFLESGLKKDKAKFEELLKGEEFAEMTSVFYTNKSKDAMRALMPDTFAKLDKMVGDVPVKANGAKEIDNVKATDLLKASIEKSEKVIGAANMKNIRDLQGVDDMLEKLNKLDDDGKVEFIKQRTEELYGKGWKNIDMPEPYLMKDVEKVKKEVSYVRDQFGKEAKEMADWFRKEFDEMGDKEGLDMLANYLTHMLNPELSKKDMKEAMKVLEEKGLNVKDPFNVFALHRQWGDNIEHINKKMKEKHGIDDFFDTNVVRLWANRKMAHNQLMYKKDVLDATIKNFGHKTLRMADIKDMDRVEKAAYISGKLKELGVEHDASESYINLRNKYNQEIQRLKGKGEMVFFKLNPEYTKVNARVVDNEALAEGMNATNASRERILNAKRMIDPDDIAQSLLDEELRDPFMKMNLDSMDADHMFEYSDDGTVMMPKRVFEAYEKNMKRQFQDDKSAFVRVFSKFTRLFKVNATAVNPAFHVNNTIGNTFQNWLDVGIHMFRPDVQKETFKAVRAAESKWGGEAKMWNGMTANEFIDYARKHGVIENGMFDEQTSDFLRGDSVNIGASRFSKKNILQRMNPANEDKMLVYAGGRKVGSVIENQARLTNFITHLKKGMSPEEAAMMTNKYLFDYSDLSDFEHRIMKNIVPFYAWARKNVPLQMEQMMKQPEKYLATNSAYNQLDQDETEQQAMVRPKYLQNAVHLGGGKYVNVNLPSLDLQKLTNPLTENYGSLNPLIKLAAEIPTNKNVYFDSAIKANPYSTKPMPVTGQEVDPRIPYAMNAMIPSLKILDKMANGDTDNVQQWARGMKTYDVDPNELAKYEESAYLQLLKDKRKALLDAKEKAEAKNK